MIQFILARVGGFQSHNSQHFSQFTAALVASRYFFVTCIVSVTLFLSVQKKNKKNGNAVSVNDTLISTMSKVCPLIFLLAISLQRKGTSSERF